jgi:hypothetical protein
MLGQVVEQGEDRFVAEWTDADGLELRTTFPTERQAVEHVARHGGPALRVHDLRHSYATWLVSNNVPINDAQRVMGHEQASTLLDLYTHASRTGTSGSGILSSPGTRATGWPRYLPDTSERFRRRWCGGVGRRGWRGRRVRGCGRGGRDASG